MHSQNNPAQSTDDIRPKYNAGYTYQTLCTLRTIELRPLMVVI